MKGVENIYMRLLWKKEKSAQSLTNAAGFSENGILTEGGGESVFFRVGPTNVSVLSDEAVSERIRGLATLLCAQPDIEMFCMDAGENFSDNVLYLERRAKEEDNPAVRTLLSKDREFLERMQTGTSTSRVFYFLVRSGKDAPEGANAVGRIEKCINGQGFVCRREEREGLKRTLSGYFGIRNAEMVPEEHDGDGAVSGWIIPD